MGVGVSKALKTAKAGTVADDVVKLADNVVDIADDAMKVLDDVIPYADDAIETLDDIAQYPDEVIDNLDEALDAVDETASKGGGATKVISNLGNEIDITPASNHCTVPKNPGPKGTPNSSVDILDDTGNIATRRWYDSEGNAYRDVDMTNHGNPKTHPEHPHEHIWDWSSGNPKRSK